jgi:sec-independent protein translocase protein TatA
MFEGLLQPTHLLLILVIAIVIFGPKRLPELGKSLGASLRGFKDAMNDHTDVKETHDNQSDLKRP